MPTHGLLDLSRRQVFPFFSPVSISWFFVVSVLFFRTGNSAGGKIDVFLCYNIDDKLTILAGCAILFQWCQLRRHYTKMVWYLTPANNFLLLHQKYRTRCDACGISMELCGTRRHHLGLQLLVWLCSIMHWRSQRSDPISWLEKLLNNQIIQTRCQPYIVPLTQLWIPFDALHQFCRYNLIRDLSVE